MVMALQLSRDGENLTSSSTAVADGVATDVSAFVAPQTPLATGSTSTASPSLSFFSPILLDDSQPPIDLLKSASVLTDSKNINASPSLKPVGISSKKSATFQRVDATKKFLSMKSNTPAIKASGPGIAAVTDNEKPRNSIGSGTAKLVMMKGSVGGGPSSVSGGSVWNRNRPVNVASTSGAGSGFQSTVNQNLSSMFSAHPGPGLSPSPRQASAAVRGPSADPASRAPFSGPTPMEAHPTANRPKETKMGMEPRTDSANSGSSSRTGGPPAVAVSTNNSQGLAAPGPTSGRKTSFCWADEAEDDEDTGMSERMAGMTALQQVRDLHQTTQVEPTTRMIGRTTGDSILQSERDRNRDRTEFERPQPSFTAGTLAGNGVRMGWRVLERERGPDSGRDQHRDNYQDQFPGLNQDREKAARLLGINSGIHPGGPPTKRQEQVVILHRDRDVFKPVNRQDVASVGGSLSSPVLPAAIPGHVRQTSRSSISSLPQPPVTSELGVATNPSNPLDHSEPVEEEDSQVSRKKMLAAAAEARERRKREEAEEEAARLQRCAEKIAKLGLAPSVKSAASDPAAEAGTDSQNPVEKPVPVVERDSEPRLVVVVEVKDPNNSSNQEQENKKSEVETDKEWDWRKKRTGPIHLLRRNETLEGGQPGDRTGSEIESKPEQPLSIEAPSVQNGYVTTQTATPSAVSRAGGKTPTILAHVRPFVPASNISRSDEANPPDGSAATPKKGLQGKSSQPLGTSQIQIQTPGRQGQVQTHTPQNPHSRQAGPATGPNAIPASAPGPGPVSATTSTAVPPFPTTPVSANVWGPPSVSANRILGNGTFGILHFGEHGQTTNHVSGPGGPGPNVGNSQSTAEVAQVPGIGMMNGLGPSIVNPSNGTIPMTGQASSHGHGHNHNHAQMGMGIGNPMGMGIPSSVSMNGINPMAGGGMNVTVGMPGLPNSVPTTVSIRPGPRGIHHSHGGQFNSHPAQQQQQQQQHHQPPYHISGSQNHNHQGPSHQVLYPHSQHHQHLAHHNQLPPQALPPHHLTGSQHHASVGSSPFPYNSISSVPNIQSHGSYSLAGTGTIPMPPMPAVAPIWLESANAAQQHVHSLPDRTAVAITRSGSISLSITPTEFNSYRYARDVEAETIGMNGDVAKAHDRDLSDDAPAEQLSHFLFDEFGWVVPGGSRGHKADPNVETDCNGVEVQFHSTLPVQNEDHPAFFGETRVKIHRPVLQEPAPILAEPKKDILYRDQPEKDGWQAKFDSLLRGRGHQSNVSTSSATTVCVPCSGMISDDPVPELDSKLTPEPPVTSSIPLSNDDVIGSPVFGSKPVVNIGRFPGPDGRPLLVNRFTSRNTWSRHAKPEIPAAVPLNSHKPTSRSPIPRVWSVPPGDPGLAVVAPIRSGPPSQRPAPTPIMTVRVPGKKGMMIRKCRGMASQGSTIEVAPNTVVAAPASRPIGNEATTGSGVSSIGPVNQPTGPPLPIVKPTFANIVGGRVGLGASVTMSPVGVSPTVSVKTPVLKPQSVQARLSESSKPISSSNTATRDSKQDARNHASRVPPPSYTTPIRDPKAPSHHSEFKLAVKRGDSASAVVEEMKWPKPVQARGPSAPTKSEGLTGDWRSGRESNNTGKVTSGPPNTNYNDRATPSGQNSHPHQTRRRERPERPETKTATNGAGQQTPTGQRRDEKNGDKRGYFAIGTAPASKLTATPSVVNPSSTVPDPQSKGSSRGAGTPATTRLSMKAAAGSATPRPSSGLASDIGGNNTNPKGNAAANTPISATAVTTSSEPDNKPSTYSLNGAGPVGFIPDDDSHPPSGPKSMRGRGGASRPFSRGGRASGQGVGRDSRGGSRANRTVGRGGSSGGGSSSDVRNSNPNSNAPAVSALSPSSIQTQNKSSAASKGDGKKLTGTGTGPVVSVSAGAA